MNVQILVRLEGGFGPLSGVHTRRGGPGRLHELLEGIDPSGWIADKDYIGRGIITPHKKPPTTN